MTSLNDIIDVARADRRHIVLPEGADPRIAAAAVRASRDGIADVTLLGNEAAVRDAGGDAKWVQIVDPQSSPDLLKYADTLLDLRRHKGMDVESARLAAQDPLTFAQLMVRSGDGDGSVSGAVHPTADVIRSAIQIIGATEAGGTISSFFVMIFDQDFHDPKRTLVFADCAINIDPTGKQLADIAVASADNARAFLQVEPKVAMLSFSTYGSAKHDHVDIVTQATQLIKGQRPDMHVDGDLQFDAALMPAIGSKKAPGSSVAGAANVFVFPNLNAGNIGYKIAERLGQAKAIGPILQGLAKPANDLSRGCSTDDVYYLIAATVVQAQVAAKAFDTR